MLKRETAASLYPVTWLVVPSPLQVYVTQQINTNLAKSEPFIDSCLYKVYTIFCHSVLKQTEI